MESDRYKSFQEVVQICSQGCATVNYVVSVGSRCVGTNPHHYALSRYFQKTPERISHVNSNRQSVKIFITNCNELERIINIFLCLTSQILEILLSFGIVVGLTKNS